MNITEKFLVCVFIFSFVALAFTLSRLDYYSKSINHNEDSTIKKIMSALTSHPELQEYGAFLSHFMYNKIDKEIKEKMGALKIKSNLGDFMFIINDKIVLYDLNKDKIYYMTYINKMNMTLEVMRVE